MASRKQPLRSPTFFSWGSSPGLHAFLHANWRYWYRLISSNTSQSFQRPFIKSTNIVPRWKNLLLSEVPVQLAVSVMKLIRYSNSSSHCLRFHNIFLSANGYCRLCRCQVVVFKHLAIFDVHILYPDKIKVLFLNIQYAKESKNFSHCKSFRKHSAKLFWSDHDPCFLTHPDPL